MTITAAPLSINHRGSAVSASAWFHTSDPGTFAITYPAGITGPATVTAAGTRTYRLAREYDYDGWECDTPGFGQAIKECSILFEYNTELISKVVSTLTHYQPLIASNYGLGKSNWAFILVRGTNATSLFTQISLSDGAGVTQYIPLAAYINNVLGARRACIRVTGTTLTYLDSLGITWSQTIGTIVSTNAGAILRNWACGSVGYYARLISDGERSMWIGGGARPALSAGDEYWSGVEEQGNIAYAESAAANDGVLNQSATYPATRMNRTYTDTCFTSPLVEVPITIAADCTAGAHVITLRRNRQGVPARVPALSDAVLYDDGTIPVTVVAIPAVVHTGPVQIIQARMTDNPVAYVQITSDREGTVNISCDRTIIDFPLTAIIGPTLEVTIEGAILKGGDCDVTAVMV